VHHAQPPAVHESLRAELQATWTNPQSLQKVIRRHQT